MLRDATRSEEYWSLWRLIEECYDRKVLVGASLIKKRNQLSDNWYGYELEIAKRDLQSAIKNGLIDSAMSICETTLPDPLSTRQADFGNTLANLAHNGFVVALKDAVDGVGQSSTDLPRVFNILLLTPAQIDVHPEFEETRKQCVEIVSKALEGREGQHDRLTDLIRSHDDVYQYLLTYLPHRNAASNKPVLKLRLGRALLGRRGADDSVITDPVLPVGQTRPPGVDVVKPALNIEKTSDALFRKEMIRVRTLFVYQLDSRQKRIGRKHFDRAIGRLARMSNQRTDGYSVVKMQDITNKTRYVSETSKTFTNLFVATTYTVKQRLYKPTLKVKFGWFPDKASAQQFGDKPF